MKRRARVAWGAVVLGAALVVVLVIVGWDTVRDHVQAWHFQLTRETKTIDRPSDEETAWHPGGGFEEFVVFIAASELRSPVIFDPRELVIPGSNDLNARIDFIEALERTGDDIRSRLQKLGWRVLEQRFPRKACVLIRSSEPLQADETLQEFQLFVPPQPILWDRLHPPARREESNWGRDREYSGAARPGAR